MPPAGAGPGGTGPANDELSGLIVLSVKSENVFRVQISKTHRSDAKAATFIQRHRNRIARLDRFLRSNQEPSIPMAKTPSLPVPTTL